MLVSSLKFWENTTNTFQTPYGMITPTLFDVAGITGLRPTDEVFNPTVLDEGTIEFDQKRTNFAKFINHCHDTTIDELSDKEHIVFLTMWLSHFFM